MTFKEKYQAGEIEFEAIDDYVDEWNNSDDERTLAKFLGLNADGDAGRRKTVVLVCPQP